MVQSEDLTPVERRTLADDLERVLDVLPALRSQTDRRTRARITVEINQLRSPEAGDD
ncbi:MAG: hypothetical protein WCP28_07480 [Actinomycetes bacterium]